MNERTLFRVLRKIDRSANTEEKREDDRATSQQRGADDGPRDATAGVGKGLLVVNLLAGVSADVLVVLRCRQLVAGALRIVEHMQRFVFCGEELDIDERKLRGEDRGGAVDDDFCKEQNGDQHHQVSDAAEQAADEDVLEIAFGQAFADEVFRIEHGLFFRPGEEMVGGGIDAEDHDEEGDADHEERAVVDAAERDFAELLSDDAGERV